MFVLCLVCLTRSLFLIFLQVDNLSKLPVLLILSSSQPLCVSFFPVSHVTVNSIQLFGFTSPFFPPCFPLFFFLSFQPRFHSIPRLHVSVCPSILPHDWTVRQRVSRDWGWDRAMVLVCPVCADSEWACQIWCARANRRSQVHHCRRTAKAREIPSALCYSRLHRAFVSAGSKGIEWGEHQVGPWQSGRTHVCRCAQTLSDTSHRIYRPTLGRAFTYKNISAYSVSHTGKWLRCWTQGDNWGLKRFQTEWMFYFIFFPHHTATLPGLNKLMLKQLLYILCKHTFKPLFHIYLVVQRKENKLTWMYLLLLMNVSCWHCWMFSIHKWDCL